MPGVAGMPKPQGRGMPGVAGRQAGRRTPAPPPGVDRQEDVICTIPSRAQREENFYFTLYCVPYLAACSVKKKYYILSLYIPYLAARSSKKMFIVILTYTVSSRAQREKMF